MGLNESYNSLFPEFILQMIVVRAYKNLLQEKEASEASVNVLTTTSNQLHVTKSYQKEAAECETKDQNEKLESEKNSTSKAEVAKSPVNEEGSRRMEC